MAFHLFETRPTCDFTHVQRGDWAAAAEDLVTLGETSFVCTMSQRHNKKHGNGTMHGNPLVNIKMITTSHNEINGYKMI